MDNFDEKFDQDEDIPEEEKDKLCGVSYASLRTTFFFSSFFYDPEQDQPVNKATVYQS